MLLLLRKDWPILKARTLVVDTCAVLIERPNILVSCVDVCCTNVNFMTGTIIFGLCNIALSVI